MLRDGQPDHAALREQRLTVGELKQAVRSAGVGGFDQCAAVVLESDGTLSVITRSKLGDGTALDATKGWPAPP